jgi:hypothetical protein
MIFDLDEGNTGEWFTFFESEVKEDGSTVYHKPKKNAGRVCFRVADADTMDGIYEKTRTRAKEWVHNPKTRAMERWTGFDQTPEQEKLERRLLWDYAIVGWDKLMDKTGKEIPVTIDNKMKLMAIPAFMRFANRCLQLISGAQEERKEELEKN